MALVDDNVLVFSPNGEFFAYARGDGSVVMARSPVPGRLQWLREENRLFSPQDKTTNPFSFKSPSRRGWRNPFGPKGSLALCVTLGCLASRDMPPALSGRLQEGRGSVVFGG
jgi:hypothetical protein